MSTGPHPGAALRVMTLNIWGYNEPWARRRRLIAACINERQPDIIGLQEIHVEWRRSFRNQARQFAALLRDRYHRVYRPGMTYRRWPLVQEGLAVLSRWPITRSEATRLTRDADDPRDRHQRIVLHAEVDAPCGPVHFCTTHWSLSPAARLRNAAETRALVSRLVGTGPVILVGDLNATPDGASVQMLFGATEARADPPAASPSEREACEAAASQVRMGWWGRRLVARPAAATPARQGLGACRSSRGRDGRATMIPQLGAPADRARGALLVDAWAALRPAEPGCTFRSDRPAARIDYIAYHVGDDKCGRPVLVSLVGDQAMEGLWPSDHLGVVAEFEMAGSE